MRLPDPERSRVVLIGASSYEDEKLPDLPAVRRGIEDLKTVLTDPVYGVVPDSYCDVLEDEGDIRLIGRRLRRAANQAQDLLLVYFAGHGLTAGRRHELYLGLRETEWEEPEFSALEYDKLRDAVLKSPAATKVIILDCCFSGRAFGDTMADPTTELIGQVEVDGSCVLASAHRDQVSLILQGEDHPAFTGRLLRLLHDGVPDGPELLTIDAIYQQLRVTMRAEGLPQPHRRGTDNASLLALTRNRAFAATSAMQPPPSERNTSRPLLFGDRYELEAVAGRGSITDVYRAYDLQRDCEVAIKSLRTDLAHDQALQARFRHEAQSIASLNNPSIVAVYANGEDLSSGVSVPFIAMEFVDGRTCRDLLTAYHRLPPERTLEIVSGVLCALDYAHEAGLVHRYIKSSNVMVTSNGEVKVMDFGVGRTNTRADITPEYPSPEQARGERVDGRSDLYSTGCLMYELLTGRPPFTGDSRMALINHHIYGHLVPPSGLVPSLPLWADPLVLKAMARSRDDRYQSAAEMRADVRSAAVGLPTAAAIPPASARHSDDPREASSGDDLSLRWSYEDDVSASRSKEARPETQKRRLWSWTTGRGGTDGVTGSGRGRRAH